ncbi:hypothetical protein HDU88_002517 [Geranomyces variabilis]|nr:hypothetical protein HDU88_002517 [Geranomyces variabilis]
MLATAAAAAPTTHYYIDLENIRKAKRLCEFFSDEVAPRYRDHYAPFPVEYVFAARLDLLRACETILACRPGEHVKIVFIHGGDKGWKDRVEVLRDYARGKQEGRAAINQRPREQRHDGRPMIGKVDIEEIKLRDSRDVWRELFLGDRENANAIDATVKGEAPSEKPLFAGSSSIERSGPTLLPFATSAGEWYYCDKCAETPIEKRQIFDSPAALLKHLTSHPSFLCDMCGKILGTECALIAHKRAHVLEGDESIGLPKWRKHAEVMRKPPDDAVKGAITVRFKDEPDDASLPGYCCDICGRYQPSENSFKDHKAKHRRAGENDPKLFTQEQRDLHKLEWMVKLKREACKGESSSADTGHQCPICGKFWETKASMMSHKGHHTRKKETKDDFPQEVWELHEKQWRLLTQGSKVLHIAELDDAHSCAVCGRCFKTPGLLNVHTDRHRERGETADAYDEKDRVHNHRRWMASRIV